MPRGKKKEKIVEDVEEEEEELDEEGDEDEEEENPTLEGEDLDAFDLEEIPQIDEEVYEKVEEEDVFEEEIELERIYTVPLAKGFMKAPKWKQAKKAVKYLREFLTQHMKPVGPIYISQELNERIWENGMKNPPRKIRVRVTKSVDGVVRAYLAL